MICFAISTFTAALGLAFEKNHVCPFLWCLAGCFLGGRGGGGGGIESCLAFLEHSSLRPYLFAITPGFKENTRDLSSIAEK